LDDDDPRLALCGVDKIEARKWLANIGFDSIVDAGLGRLAAHFNRYRVTVFDREHPIDRHFASETDASPDLTILGQDAYQRIEAELGRCGASEIAGASVAAPFVSAVAAALAISRLIAVVSGCPCPVNDIGQLSSPIRRRLAPTRITSARGAKHAGKPFLKA
jgi:hypothetical protein